MSFEAYTKALFANYKDTNNIELKDAERAVVNSYIVNDSLIGLLGTNLQIGEVNRAVITVLKNLGHEFKDKTAPGVKEFEAGKFEKEIITWKKPKFQSVAFTEADKYLGIPESASIKLQKASADFARLYEAECWKELEQHIMTKSLVDTKTLTSKDGKEIYTELVALGTELSKLEDKDEGIAGIERQDIIIFVKPEIFDKLATVGLVGNAAQSTLENGRYGIATLGGYKIYANRYLSSCDAIAATNFTAASMTNIIAANIDQLKPTNDIGLYFEAMFAFGVVYGKTIKALN